MAASSRLQGLQALRAVAALLVVFFHIAGELTGQHATLFDGWIGAIGVDIFFVISGYIMFRIMNGTGQGLRPSLLFLAHRIGRIVPIYWLVTLLVIIAWLLTGRDLIFANGVPPSALRFTLSFGLATVSPLVLVGWTLSFEMFFYVLSSLAIIAFRTILARFVFVALVLICLTAVGQIFDLQRPFVLRSLILEFAVGGAIFLLTDRYRFPTWTALSAAAAAVIGGILLSSTHAYTHGSPFWVVVAGSAVFAAIVAERAVPWHRFSLGQALGDASYSLYLTHLYVLIAISALVFESGLAPTGGGLGRFVVLILVPLAACPVALLVYAKVERPLARWATRRLVELVDGFERFVPDRRGAGATTSDTALGLR